MMKRSAMIFFSALIIVFSCLMTPGIHAQVKTQKKRPSEPTLEFKSPVRITFGYKGNLYVSDSLLRMIMTVDPRDNKIIDAFPVNGEPLGVAYHNRYIYVGNESKSCVQVYNIKGNWVKDIGSNIRRPTDIAIDASLERMFVADTLRRTVFIFSVGGQFIRAIPSSPDPDILTAPTGIALDTVNQHVFVSDYGDGPLDIDPRVQIFDYNGNHVGFIPGNSGGWFNPELYFSRPQGLWVDDSGHVYLVDCNMSEIQVYDRYSKELLTKIGSHATNEGGQFRLPLDIVIDERTKDIFVTNNRLMRIEVFRNGGM